MTVSANQSLILSNQSNQARLVGQGDAVWIDWLPYWFCAALGISNISKKIIHFSELSSHPLRGLLALARDIKLNQTSVSDYLLEFQTHDSDSLFILVDGFSVENNSSAEYIFSMQDVSDIVRERRRAAAIGTYHGIVGRSLLMLDVFHRISIYGPSEASVIVTGETGTGKELVARALHDRSPRQGAPFVAVNCTALTPELFESELFGHEKGSFTGAYRQHRGRFERANGGTLFLDEIGDMPPVTQAKLLRALEEGVIERVGSEQEQRVNVRVVAATNVALEQSVAQKQFRSDLYHRLCVFRIHLPPLRERVGDLPLLVEYFVEHFNRRYNRQVKRLTPEALRLLEEYTWPGNIRELRNVMERLFVETTGEAIGARALAGWVAEREYLLPGEWNADRIFASRSPIISAPSFSSQPSGRNTTTRDVSHFPPVLESDSIKYEQSVAEKPVPELTPQCMRDAFLKTNGNITQAAHYLGVHKATFYRQMKRLGLERKDLEGE